MGIDHAFGELIRFDSDAEHNALYDGNIEEFFFDWWPTCFSWKLEESLVEYAAFRADPRFEQAYKIGLNYGVNMKAIFNEAIEETLMEMNLKIGE